MLEHWPQLLAIWLLGGLTLALIVGRIARD